jgi:hypothetical protein
MQGKRKPMAKGSAEAVNVDSILAGTRNHRVWIFPAGSVTWPDTVM